MPMPKRVQLRRMQVQCRRPNRFEAAPLGKSYAQMRWSAHLVEGHEGELIVRLTSRTQPSRGDILQAVICCALRWDPDCSVSDLMDLAGCSRETAHRRKQLGIILNARYDARLAARRAVARRRPSS